MANNYPLILPNTVPNAAFEEFWLPYANPEAYGYPQTPRADIIPPPPPTNLPALDASSSVVTNANGGVGISITTTKANDIMMVIACGPVNASSISGAGLPWTLRTAFTDASQNFCINSWWAVDPTAARKTFTVNWPGTHTMAVWALAVTNVGSGNPFDPGAFPTEVTADSPLVTLSQGYDFVVSAISCDQASPATPAGFTQIAGPNTSYFANCCYAVSSLQNYTITYGVNDSCAVYVDALVP